LGGGGSSAEKKTEYQIRKPEPVAKTVGKESKGTVAQQVRIEEKKQAGQEPVKIQDEPAKAEEQIGEIYKPEPASENKPKAAVPPPANFKRQTISININQPAVAEKTEEETQNDVAVETTDFTKDELLAAWKTYAERLKENNKTNLYITLTKNDPQLKENYQIELTLDNSAQEEVLTDEKINLLDYLRKELKNTQITLKTTVDSGDQDERPITPRDRYIKLAEKNPNIDKLRQQLDLDIDC